MTSTGARKAITPRMKVNALLHQVYVQFGEYLKCGISGEPMKPEDDVQFDHGLEHKDGGEHHWRNLRGVLGSPHKRKSAKSEAFRHHIDRLEKERNGEPKRARDKYKKRVPSQPLRSRSDFKDTNRAKAKIAPRPFQKRPEETTT